MLFKLHVMSIIEQNMLGNVCHINPFATGYLFPFYINARKRELPGRALSQMMGT